MRRALDLIHFIVKESVTESTTKFGFDLSDLTCGMEDDGEMVRQGFSTLRIDSKTGYDYVSINTL